MVKVHGRCILWDSMPRIPIILSSGMSSVEMLSKSEIKNINFWLEKESVSWFIIPAVFVNFVEPGVKIYADKRSISATVRVGAIWNISLGAWLIIAKPGEPIVIRLLII